MEEKQKKIPYFATMCYNNHKYREIPLLFSETKESAGKIPAKIREVRHEVSVLRLQ